METTQQGKTLRSRSSRRLRYEAKASTFVREKGDLERIRTQLGLRPSQMCELLKVHPSAWIRWTRSKSAPPHVYQSLEWYLELLSWRGQRHPLMDRDQVQVAQTVTQQDPSSHVPPEVGEFESKTPLFGWFYTPKIAWFLVGLVTFQLLLTLFVVFNGRK
ncbi:MAG: hypothetical protein IT289_01095 [Oligoflexia bacterium]|nr:hypothetical protein [Oligoflexia bacterium]